MCAYILHPKPKILNQSYLSTVTDGVTSYKHATKSELFNEVEQRTQLRYLVTWYLYTSSYLARSHTNKAIKSHLLQSSFPLHDKEKDISLD